MAKPRKLFARHADADSRVASAISLLQAILPLDIDDRMKRRFVSNCLWQITEAEGKNKYDLRYRSKGAQGSKRQQCRHEHVWRRKDMVQRLIEQPASLHDIVKVAVGCVVTVDEHDRLAAIDSDHPEVDGWERYRLAKVRVVDMATGKLLKFAAPE